MKQICSFGRLRARRTLTLADIRSARAEGRKLSHGNALEVAEAAAVAMSGIDIASVAVVRLYEALVDWPPRPRMALWWLTKS